MSISNKELIQYFYTSFQNKDYKAMQGCYHEDAAFSDEVFKGLDAPQVRAMWEMLLRRAKDLELTFSNVQADDMKGSAMWKATYTFSQTGRKVVNHITAGFIFHDGRIIQHVDSFDFYAWARQALGMSGLLFGWTDFMKKKIQLKAIENLNKYMQSM